MQRKLDKQEPDATLTLACPVNFPHVQTELDGLRVEIRK